MQVIFLVLRNKQIWEGWNGNCFFFFDFCAVVLMMKSDSVVKTTVGRDKVRRKAPIKVKKYFIALLFKFLLWVFKKRQKIFCRSHFGLVWLCMWEYVGLIWFIFICLPLFWESFAIVFDIFFLAFLSKAVKLFRDKFKLWLYSYLKKKRIFHLFCLQVVLRRLPAGFTWEQLRTQLEPLPETEFVQFVPADSE